LIFGALGWFNAANAAYTRGEKAVASYDEDSLTMAVTAGLNCLGERERGKTAGLFLATTTPPYKERSVAAIAATALNLPAGVRSVDFNGSLKAGTGALLAGCEAVAENGGEVLVCAADCRLGKAGSAQEYLFGDCAVAFSVGKEDVAATFEGFYSTTHDFVDHRRLEGDLFDRTWEERWIREEGYAKLIPEVIAGLLQKYDLQIGDFAKLIFPCPFDRVQVAVAGKLGATRDQVSPALMAEVGDTGTAQPLLMLAAALEDAAPGDRLLVAGFGNGCDALIFRVTEEIKKIKGLSGFKAGLARKRQLASYEKYAGFRHLLDLETGIRGEQVAFTSFPVLWRERKSVLALCGVQCRRCGTPQFPYQRVCVNPRCGAVDEMDEYCFAGKKGSIFTYTADHLAFSPEPPAVYGIVDFAGGGRYWFDFTDFNLAGLQVGMPVALNFRRKYADLARGVYGYFWKAVPVLEQGVDLNG
jgi:3-hydroxy-3-methylglutaryl CoA synthase